MEEILRLASMVIVADQPFYKNVYVIVPAALVVAVIILVVALLLFRSSGKKKRASAAGSSDWQRQAQQGAPGGWNQQGMGMPAAGPWAQQGQQPNMWGAQQPGGWDAQNPAPQQQQGASPWSGQGNQPAPAAYGGGGSGQSWAQPAQVADQWGQPVQQPVQPAQQGGWPGGYQQPSSSTPPGGNAPWQQPGQGFGQGQQGFVAGPFESVEGDKTMLRSTGGPQGIGIVRIEEGKEPGRVYEVRKETLSIGRSRESDIFLEDLAVSRLHASIINLGNNNYALRDEGSANGTKVNGQVVNKYQPYPLQEGDKIQLGQTVLVFGKR